MGRLKEMVRQWLELMPAQNNALVIQEPLTFERNAIKNRVIYRGDPSELEQLFRQIATDEVAKARFWASIPSKGQRIRKIHSGLPGMIVNILSDIVVTDMLDIEFENIRGAGGQINTWKKIEEENSFKELVTKAIQEVLIAGDGAFKISFDTELSELPIIEFFSGEQVEYRYNRGRLQEVLFHTQYYKDKRRTYTLTETYGKGYVHYSLTNQSGAEVLLSALDETKGLENVQYPNKDILAVPLMIYPSPKWEGRGRSIFDLKLDAFDALDETISQWQDSLRQGRIKRYIPESIIPRDPDTGKAISPNPFDNQFVALRSTEIEGAEQKIHTDQPQLDYEGFINTYINNLDLCLQGLVSPSTLGIDTKKLDNAEAQREKEKTTLYTRNKIISVLQIVIPKLVSVALNADANLKRENAQEIECTVEFGEYANPSFEAQVETIGKAASSQIMSIDSQIKSLWGDSKEEKWIEDEILRVKQEKGLVEMQEPMVKPHGFAEEELINEPNSMGGGAVRGNGTVPDAVNEPQPQKAHAGGVGRGGEVDPMASAATKGNKPVQSPNKPRR